MRVYQGLDEFSPPPGGCVLTVGNFDGVHLGHQKIIAQARHLARQHALPLVALTFEPSPLRVLRPDKAPHLLSPFEIKVKLLAEQGLEHLVVIEPTPDFLALTAEQFAADILVARFGVRHMVEGQTFAFGRRREGTMISLDKLAAAHGFTAHLVSACTVPLDDDGPVAVSSTLIRRRFLQCRFDQVACCLGRYLSLGGTVGPGRGQGRQMGFPTANLQFYSEHQQCCEDGVYAGVARLGASLDEAWTQRQCYPAAISLGRCQTFGAHPWQLEAHLLDCPGGQDLYGRHLLLTPVQRLRSQEVFSSTDSLVAAIEADCVAVRRVLAQLGDLVL